MDDEAKRINEFIAERVMGWHKRETNGLLNGIKPIKVAFWYNEQDDLIMQVDRYDPFHDTSQAIEAAEKFCDTYAHTGWHVGRTPYGNHYASVSMVTKDCEWSDLVDSANLTMALRAAVKEMAAEEK